MLKNDKVLALTLVITVLLGGCNEGTDNVKSTEAVVQAGDEQEISMNTEDLVSVQDYNGEEYASWGTNPVSTQLQSYLLV